MKRKAEDATVDAPGADAKDPREKAREDLVRLLVDSVLEQVLAEGDTHLRRRRRPDPVLLADDQLVHVLGRVAHARTVSTDGKSVRVLLTGAAADDWYKVESLRNIVGRMMAAGLAASDLCACSRGPRAYVECCHRALHELAETWKQDLEFCEREHAPVSSRRTGSVKKRRRKP